MKKDGTKEKQKMKNKNKTFSYFLLRKEISILFFPSCLCKSVLAKNAVMVMVMVMVMERLGTRYRQAIG